MSERTETIYLGAGCFWCTEAVFKGLKGVFDTTPGYAGGNKPHPTYEEVCTGLTGHAEVLKVDFDPGEVTLEAILDVYFTMHDPTSLNRQGADEGTQYRSIILFATESQRDAIGKVLDAVRGRYRKPIVTEVTPLERFYVAEEYHKDYFDKHPNNSYCALVVGPKVEKVRHTIPSALLKQPR